MTQLNPDEAPDGYVAVAQQDGCDECAFSPGIGGCLSPGYACIPSERADRTAVIFVKRSSPTKKAAPPYRGMLARVATQIGITREQAEAVAQALISAQQDAQPVAGEPVALLPTKDALTDLIAEHLRDTYHCTRVWQAWHVGTMGQDDFEPVDVSDTPAEIADAVLAMLAARAPVGLVPLTDAHAALLAARIVGADAASVVTALRLIRETERAHGIKAGKDGAK